MIIAIWIIAVCEVIRAIQNMMQIIINKRNMTEYKNMYRDIDLEFANTLKGIREGDDGK